MQYIKGAECRALADGRHAAPAPTTRACRSSSSSSALVIAIAVVIPCVILLPLVVCLYHKYRKYERLAMKYKDLDGTPLDNEPGDGA